MNPVVLLAEFCKVCRKFKMGAKGAGNWLLQKVPDWLKMAGTYVSSKYIEIALRCPVSDFRYTICVSRRKK
jgi:hypothetical protein